MRNKKLLLLITLTLIAVMACSFLLIACEKEQKPVDPNPGPNPGPGPGQLPPGPGDGEEQELPMQALSVQNAIKYLVEKSSGEYLSAVFAGSFALKGKSYALSVKSNISDDDMTAAMTVVDETTGHCKFAIYILESNLFVQTDDGVIYNIKEIDTNYLIAMINALPGVIDGLLDGVNLPLPMDMIINMVVNLMLDNPSSPVAYANENGVESFGITFNISKFLGGLAELVESDLIKDLLAGLIDFDLAGLITSIAEAVPPVALKLDFAVEGGKTSAFDVNLIDKNTESDGYDQPIVGFDTEITFGDQPVDLGIPDTLKDYVIFSLGNINLDLVLDIDTHGEPLDVLTLINAFLPDDKKFLPGESLWVEADADLKLELNVALDTNYEGSKEDKNLIHAVLYKGDDEIARVNYYNGGIYISAFGFNYKVELPLATYINDIVVKVTDAIDGVFGTQFRPDESMAGTVAKASVTSEGEVILSPSLQNLIVKVMGIVGFDKYIHVSGDRISIDINEEFINEILKLAKKDPMSLPIEGALNVQLFKGGLEFLEVALFNNSIVLRAQNFLIGTTQLTSAAVIESIGKFTDYRTDITDALKLFGWNIMSDISVDMQLEFSSLDTQLNVTALVNRILAGSNQRFDMPIALDLSKYDGVFNLKAASYIDKKTNDGKLNIELLSPDGDLLIGIYGEGSENYIDLSGLGLMKVRLSHLNIYELIEAQLMTAVNAEFENADSGATSALAMASADLELTNDGLVAAIQSQLILNIFKSFMFDPGLDLTVEANLDFGGAFGVTIDAGFMSIGLGLTLGTTNGGDDIVSVPENPETFGEYNASGAEALVSSILAVQNLELALDWYSNNVDTAYNKETRIMIRRSKAQAVGQSEKVSDNLSAPFGSIVVGIMDNWTDDSSKGLVWVALDLNGGVVKIDIGNVLSGIIGAIGGNFIPVIDIPADLKSTLVGLLDKLFTGSGSDNGEGEDNKMPVIIQVPEGALPEHDKVDQGGDAALDVMTLLKGITVKLSPSMDIDIDVAMDGTVLSDMLNELLTGLFSDMDISSLTNNAAHKHVKVNYNNTDAGVFADSLFNNLLVPIISAQAGSFVGSIAGMVKGDVQSLVNRFLPIPNFNTLDVSVAITDGNLNRIQAIASNDRNTTGQGFGAYIFNRHAEGVIEWGDQDRQVYYNKNFGGDLSSKFVTQVRQQTRGKYINSSNLSAGSESIKSVTWSYGGQNIADWTMFDSMADGEYVVVGTAAGQTISVVVTVEHKEVFAVEDIKIKAMREVPDRVTVIYKDSEGNAGEKRVIYGVDIEYTRGAYDSEEDVKEIPATVRLGANTYEFHIILEAERLSHDTVYVNAYNYRQVLDDLVASGELRMTVNNEFYRYLSAEPDFSEIYSKSIDELKSAQTFSVPVTLGRGTQFEQQYTLEVVFRPFEIYGFEIDGEKHVTIDILDYLTGTAFPEELTVIGRTVNKDGEIVEEKVTAKATWTYNPDDIDREGGQIFAGLVLNQGEYNEWNLGSIPVTVEPITLTGLVDEEYVVNTMYYYYGGVAFEDLLPEKLDFNRANGTVKKNVKVDIDFSGIEPSLDGAVYERDIVVPIIVDGYNRGNLYEGKIKIVLPSVKMDLLDEDKQMTISIDEYRAQGNSLFAEKMDIRLGDEVVEAEVTWFTDDIKFEVPGTYMAYVIIADNTAYRQYCAVTVTIVASQQ